MIAAISQRMLGPFPLYGEANRAVAQGLSWFSRLDRSIVYFFNRTLAHPLLDIFFVTITSSRFLKLFLSLLLIVLIWRGGRKGRRLAGLAILCLVFTDLTNRYLLKEWFARPRPTHVLPGLRWPMGFGGDYGFPSNHAANLFGFAFLLSFFYRSLAIPLFALAFLASWARVYGGKHYPSDILAGAFYGVAVSCIFIYLGRRTAKPLDEPQEMKCSESQTVRDESENACQAQ